MKILGIDPGSRITGFGLIEAKKLKFSYVNSGCIRTKGDLNDRIITIYEGIKEIIDKHEVDIVCLLYTSPSPRDATLSRMPSSA